MIVWLIQKVLEKLWSSFVFSKRKLSLVSSVPHAGPAFVYITHLFHTEYVRNAPFEAALRSFETTLKSQNVKNESTYKMCIMHLKAYLILL